MELIIATLEPEASRMLHLHPIHLPLLFSSLEMIIWRHVFAAAVVEELYVETLG